MTEIAEHLRALVGQQDIPEDAVRALVARIDEAAPPLRALVAKAADGTRLTDDEAGQFFFGLHVLAGAGDTATFPALLRFLRRPAEEVDDLLGVASLVTLPRVVASLFDGDGAALLAAVRDPQVEDSVRDALLGAAVFLTWKGRIPLEATRACLVAFDETPVSPDGDMAWIGWAQSIALLGQRDLLPRVMRAFARKRMPEDAIEMREVDEACRDAERAPDNAERFAAANLGYVEDVVDMLRDLEEIEDEDHEPFLNPNRDIGRNDPCPCGSGKKFKKCCLREA